jgi:ribose 5-phosphate isomerase B
MIDRLIIGNDHGGVEAKRAIAAHLAARGLRVTNAGSDTGEIVRYPRYARLVAGAVARGEYPRGILICSTGIGMSIAANKVRGVRAALCTSVHMAAMTRQHNDSNVLCLGGKITPADEMLAIVDAWLANDYIGGRHEISLGLIRDLEREVGLGVPAPGDRADGGAP